jgi:hypothetical protein
MKTFLKIMFFYLLCLMAFCFLPMMQSIAQDKTHTRIKQESGNLLGDTRPDLSQIQHVTSHDPHFKLTSTPCFYKRKSEWQKIIDIYWGPGATLAQKLSYFDYFSGYVRAHNPTFTYTKLNWDSVSAYWRSKITDCTSRGGFSAILSYLAYQLNDGPHVWACDSVLYSTPLNPGTPILVGIPYDIFGFGTQHFGAALTVLPDSSLLVYRVVPNHPLGLEPGDKVLGYDGVPWRTIVRELIAAEVPIVAYTGSAPSAAEYYLEFCAGMNWHLFDTIDVIKYKSGQAVHLSTDTLTSLQKPAALSVDGAQLPVPGVQMPGCSSGSNGYFSSDAVTYGIVQGTNIGYIYIYHHQLDNVGKQFNAAVAALANTQGIIIDLRFDNGGWIGLNDGIARLTSYAGPTLTSFTRSSSSDLWSLVPLQTFDYSIPQDNLRYEHPVAVLLGPACVSYGDITARQLTYLDNVHFFGKSTMGIYSGHWGSDATLPGFDVSCVDFTLLDSRLPSLQLWARDFPLDEEVWLTRDGVAKGEDDVVKRALEWMNNLVYPHNIITDKSYYTLSKDTVHLSTIIENPNSYQISARAYIKTVEDVLIDSIDLSKQTVNGKAENWAVNIIPPQVEEFYKVSVTVFDQISSTSLSLPNATRYTTAGPVTLDSISYRKGLLNYHYFRPFVHNKGNIKTVTNASLRIICNDPWIASIGSGTAALPNIAPNSSVGISSWITISVIDSLYPGYFNFKVEIMSDGWAYWADSMKVNVITGFEDEVVMPSAFKLEQNFPNPFNNSSAIEYSLPNTSKVIIKVFNVLGTEIQTLVNEEKSAGNYEVTWYANNLPSGVYFYRIQAVLSSGSGQVFIDTKKMILLK